MSFTEKHSVAKWINDIAQILDENQLTSMDLLRQLLRYGHAFPNLAPHKASLVSNVDLILELFFEVSAESLKQAAGKFMKEVYRDELLYLVAKPQGFHFGARTATLEQLEEFSIEQLAQKMGVLCPHLSDLLCVLLDANSVRRRRTQPETELIDDDSSIESEEEEEEINLEKQTDLEDDDGDEDWEDISNSDSDSDSDSNADEENPTEDTNSSDSDVSMRSSTVSLEGLARGVVSSPESLVPEMITALPEQTFISPDAKRRSRRRRRTQNAARRNHLLITIVCKSQTLCESCLKNH